MEKSPLIESLHVSERSGPSSVEVIDLHKTYTTGKIEYQALRGVTLSVRKGEFVAIVGPSGSGKTTLMNIIGTLDRPTSGEVLIDGIPVSSMNNDEYAVLRNRKLGFVFQSFNLIGYLTAVENVELPLIASGIGPRTRQKKATEILAFLGLREKGEKMPNELSGGEQQRVAVARALINDPALVLADEPTGNLDSKSAEAVVSYLREASVQRDVTVMMITHNLELTKWCNEVFHIKDGLIEDIEVRNR